jgi:hypothetical protein
MGWDEVAFEEPAYLHLPLLSSINIKKKKKKETKLYMQSVEKQAQSYTSEFKNSHLRLTQAINYIPYLVSSTK